MKLFEVSIRMCLFLSWRNSPECSKVSSLLIDAKTSTRQNTLYLQVKVIHAAGGIRGRIPSKQAAAGIGCVYSDLIFFNRFSKNPQM